MAGLVLFFMNWRLLSLPFAPVIDAGMYVLTLTVGYICLLMAGVWASRMLRHNLIEDVFNDENENFQQETRYLGNEYSVNLPTRFYYNKRWNDG